MTDYPTHRPTAPRASALKSRCDYGLCSREAALIVQTQADPTNHVLGEERPMCPRHALTFPHRGTSVAVVEPRTFPAPNAADRLTFDQCEAANVDGTGRTL